MALAVLQAAQQLALLSPSFEQPITPGQTVTVSWKSPYEFTNVEVLQGPDSNGAYQTDILAANATQDTNTLSWTANSAPGNDFSIPFLFRLQKGDLPNDCVLCTTTTAAFQVVDPNAPAPDTSNPQATSAETAEMMLSATTAATEATSNPSTDSATESTMQAASSTVEATSATSASETMAMPTESSTDTAAAAAAAAATSSSQTPAASPSSPAAMSSAASSSAASPTSFQQTTEENYRMPTKESLALGLGIGIPVGLFAIGMVVFLIWDKKRKQRKHQQRWDMMNSDEEKK